ncbi:MAG: ABC transporter permease DevC [Cyanobacteria bacterium P01_D01_bin.105]
MPKSSKRLSKRLLGLVFDEIPLAWSQLSHQKPRLAIAMSGISFANILIFMQLGFRATMFDGITNVADSLIGDVFLVNSQDKFIGNQSFSKDQLYRAASVDGVASADALYYSQTTWINPWNEDLVDVTVIAFNPARSLMTLPEVNNNIDAIRQPDTILFDRKSLASLGDVGDAIDSGEEVRTEMAGRRIEVGGVFSLGSTLFKRGHVVTSDVNYLRLFGESSGDNVQVGVLSLTPTANLTEAIEQLKTILPQDVAVLTREEFIDLEQSYWSKQPAGIIFNFGTIMGFIVGVIIVYQVLYSDVNDHLPEYATLKAIGFSDNRLLLVVFQEAIILGVLGFLPGFLCSTALYGVLGNLTRLAVIMRPDVAIQVFVLTIVMCLLSGAITIRKLQSADPADVF